MGVPCLLCRNLNLGIVSVRPPSILLGIRPLSHCEPVSALSGRSCATGSMSVLLVQMSWKNHFVS